VSRGLAMTGPGGQDILLLCLSRETGEELWRRTYDRGNQIQMKHNMSSPTPVTDGKHVWVISGNGMIACFDLNGNEKWKFDIPKAYGKIGVQFGYGSSPLLIGDLLVLQMLQGMHTDEPSYVFALNAADGQPRWHVERPTDALHETPDAYTTPTVVEVDGKKQIVVSGGGYITGHDPANGREALARRWPQSQQRAQLPGDFVSAGARRHDLRPHAAGAVSRLQGGRYG
jgi:outer membrane protein assembly factor BamB